MTAAARRSAAAAGRRETLVPALLAAVGCVAYVVTAYRLVGDFGLPLDDGYIHLQFARNLAAGHGLSYESGRLVAGSTAPLWTALLALLGFLPGSPVLWAQGLGAALFALAIAPVVGLAEDLGAGRGLAAFAGLMTATTGPLVWAAVSGLEIPLFVLLSVFGVRRHLRDRQQSSGIATSLPILALAALARPEGALLLGLATFDRWLAHDRRPRATWRSLWPGAAVAALVIVPVVLFNSGISGSPLPTTFAAKGAGWHRATPDLKYLHTVFGILFRSQPYLTWLAAAGVVGLFVPRERAQAHGFLPAAWCVGLPIAYSIIGSTEAPLVGNFGRYFYPLFPFVRPNLASPPALDALLGRNPTLPARVLIAALALVMSIPSLGHLVDLAGRFSQNVRNVQDGDVAAARWLAARLPPEAILAVNDVGALKFMLPEHRVLDLAGIVTPELAVYTRVALAAGRPRGDGVRAYLAQARPDYLVIFPRWFPILLANEPRYRPVKEFVVPDNVTLGGDRVVVFETPWTRGRLAP